MDLVIHGCRTASGLDVLAFAERFSFEPPPRFAGPQQDAFVLFGIEWDGGMKRRDGFKVKVPDPDRSCENHYDLVVVEDVRDGRGDLTRAQVGLHPTGVRQGDAIPVYWAE